jgi:hypothetical protein
MPHGEDSSAISNGVCERQTEDALAMLQECQLQAARLLAGEAFIRACEY